MSWWWLWRCCGFLFFFSLFFYSEGWSQFWKNWREGCKDCCQCWLHCWYCWRAWLITCNQCFLRAMGWKITLAMSCRRCWSSGSNCWEPWSNWAWICRLREWSSRILAAVRVLCLMLLQKSHMSQATAKSLQMSKITHRDRSFKLLMVFQIYRMQ